jgi:hypothetical protein
LQFTRLAFDAFHLGYDLPKHLITGVTWGAAGFDEARLWPQLPSGIVGAGDPIPSRDGRQIEIAMGSIPVSSSGVEAVFAFRFLRPRLRLLRQVDLVLDFERKPEKELSRYERRTIRELYRRLLAAPQQFSADLADLFIAEPGAAMAVLMKCSPPPLTNLSSPVMAGIMRSAKSSKIAQQAYRDWPFQYPKF